MARTGKAVVYDAPNQPFVVHEYPLCATRPGEVQIRISMAIICRSDIHSHQGHRPNSCPGVLGHEIIGTTKELGAGVELDMHVDGAIAPGAQLVLDPQ